MKERFIGTTPVSAIGLGGALWSLGDFFVPGLQPEEDQAVRTVHAALDAGVRLIDTARVYTTGTHPAHNESLIARALASHPHGAAAVVATKGGHYRDGQEVAVDVRRDAIRRDCEASLAALGVDRITLYQLHWPSHQAAARIVPPSRLRAPAYPDMDIEDALPVFAELCDEGLVEHIGICNVSLAEVERARTAVEIATVQNHFSPFDRRDLDLVEYCAEHAIAYLPWSPLGGGVRGGAAALGEAFPVAADIARRKGVSVQRLALAWLLQLSPTLIPICGARRPETICDSAQAAEVELTADELAELDFGTGKQGFYSEVVLD